MTVEELNVVLDAKIGPLAAGLGAADARIDRTEAKMAGLEAANGRAGVSFARVGSGAHTAAGGLHHAETEAERAGRGALSASGMFNRMGRAMAYASGAFVGGAAVVFGLRSIVDAAKQAQESQDQLVLAVTDSGQSWQRYGGQVDAVIRKQEKLSAFSRSDLRGSFATLERATGSVAKATDEMVLAEDVARGRHIDLASATQLVIRGSSGLVGILRRVGITITPVKAAENALTDSHKHFTAETKQAAKALDLHATGLKVIDVLARKYASSAKKYGDSAAGGADKFGNALKDFEAALGSGVLPVLNQYLGRLSAWMERMQASGKLQQDVNGLVSGGAKVLAVLSRVLQTVAHDASAVAHAVGGWKTAFEYIVGAAITLKVAKLGSAIKGIYLRLVETGAEASVAGTKIQVAAETAATKTTAATSTMSGAVVRYSTNADVAAASTAGIGAAAGTAEAETVVAATGMSAALIGLRTVIQSVLISTGIGVLIVAFSLAATYVLTHWDKVKRWFVDFGRLLPGLFNAAWHAAIGVTELAVYGLLLVFEHMAQAADKLLSWIPGIGGKIHSALLAGEAWIEQFRKDGIQQLATAGSDMGQAWGDAFDSAMQKALKKNGAVLAGKSPNALKQLPKGPGMSPPEVPLGKAAEANQHYGKPGETAAQKAAAAAAAQQKKLDAEIAKLLAGGTTTTKKHAYQALPTQIQGALANAEAALANAGGATGTDSGNGIKAVTTAQVDALKRLADAERNALNYLDHTKTTGEKLVKVEKERATIAKQLEQTEKAIASATKAQSETKIARAEEKTLGLAPGGGQVTPGRTALIQREHKILEDSIARAFGGKSHSLAVAAANIGVDVTTLLHKTNQQLIAEMKRLGIELPKATLDSLEKVNKVLKEKFIPPDVTQNIQARLQQIAEMLKSSSKTLASNYKPVHSTDIVKGLGLDKAQKLAVEMRVSQAMGHAGYAPTGGAAAGVALATGVGAGGSVQYVTYGDVTIQIDAAGKNGPALAREIRAELAKIEHRSGGRNPVPR